MLNIDIANIPGASQLNEHKIIKSENPNVFPL